MFSSHSDNILGRFEDIGQYITTSIQNLAI